MTRNAAPGLNGDIGRTTEIVLSSFARIVDGAKPEKKLRVFELQARELMGHVVSGVIDRTRTIDALQEVAKSNGLIGVHGQDAIQAIMSLAAVQPQQIPAITETDDQAPEEGGVGDPVLNEIKRLAKLPLYKYDRERADVAERFGMRASTLDKHVNAERAKHGNDKGQGHRPSIADAEPWPEPVDLGAVLDQAVALYRRYLVLPPGGAEQAAVWSMLTHVFQRFAIVPRLAVTAADRECGKSHLLRVLKTTCARAVIMTNANIAPLFRLIESLGPTLFLDEADNYLGDNPELLALLNDGYGAGGVVWRCEGEDNEVKEFRVFAPAAIAQIKRPTHTLLSRSIEIRMVRKTRNEQIANFRGDRPDPRLAEVQCKFARAAIDYGVALGAADPDMGNLINRDADNYRPLFAICDLAGGSWPGRIREIASKALSRKADDSKLQMLLADIKKLFDETKADCLPSAVMISRLTSDLESQWVDFRPGKPLTQHQLARMLRDIPITSGTVHPRDMPDAKGYKRDQFEDAWSRYLG